MYEKVEPVPALVAVGASYLAYLLGWRRIRVAQGRRKGPTLQAVARYDHGALARELASLLPATDVGAEGDRIVPIPASTSLGTLPEPWASAPWAFARPSTLVDVRDALLLGVVDRATELATGESREAVASLFAWAFFFRVFSGENETALSIARSYGELPERLEPIARRLLLQGHALVAESLPPSSERELLSTRALSIWRALDDRWSTPSLAGLGPHLEILRLGWWNLEIGEWTTRKMVRKALAHFPEAPILHLIRAHLAASLGEGQRAADHLAKALYYARGDLFYARPILESPWLSLSRPTLAARARNLVKDRRDD